MAVDAILYENKGTLSNGAQLRELTVKFPNKTGHLSKHRNELTCCAMTPRKCNTKRRELVIANEDII